MSDERGRSLRAQFPRRLDIPLLLAVGAVLLPLGRGIADVSPRAGLACFLAAVFLSASTSWIIRV